MAPFFMPRPKNFTPSDITHQQAFVDYCRMDGPPSAKLNAYYCGIVGHPPSTHLLDKWRAKYKWIARLNAMRQAAAFQKAKEAEGADSSDLVSTGMSSKTFTAREALRALASQITDVLIRVTKSSIEPISSLDKAILENSVYIHRLGGVVMDSIRLSEELDSSVQEKEAEEKSASVDDHEAEHTDYLASAMRQLAKDIKTGDATVQ